MTGRSPLRPPRGSLTGSPQADQAIEARIQRDLARAIELADAEADCWFPDPRLLSDLWARLVMASRVRVHVEGLPPELRDADSQANVGLAMKVFRDAAREAGLIRLTGAWGGDA